MPQKLNITNNLVLSLYKAIFTYIFPSYLSPISLSLREPCSSPSRFSLDACLVLTILSLLLASEFVYPFSCLYPYAVFCGLLAGLDKGATSSVFYLSTYRGYSLIKLSYRSLYYYLY